MDVSVHGWLLLVISSHHLRDNYSVKIKVIRKTSYETRGGINDLLLGHVSLHVLLVTFEHLDSLQWISSSLYQLLCLQRQQFFLRLVTV